jgi:hypothetical protein
MSFVRANVIVDGEKVKMEILEQNGYLVGSHKAGSFIFRCVTAPEIGAATIYLKGISESMLSNTRTYGSSDGALLYATTLKASLEHLNELYDAGALETNMFAEDDL